MSLKLAAWGSLGVTSARRTLHEPDDPAQNLGLVRPHEPILITFGLRNSVELPGLSSNNREIPGAQSRSGQSGARSKLLS
jgi:hypothetical protein